MAAKCCNLEIIKCLLEFGADLNAREGKQGRTILHKACEEANDTLVLFLLTECSSKLNIEAETYAGLTAYQIASANAIYSSKYHKIAQDLLKHGADPTPMPVDDSDSDGEDIPTAMHKMYTNNCAVNVA